MEGHCAEEIANAAFVSISTVRSQIKAILQKLGVNSQLAAVALARRAGWSLDSARGTLPKPRAAGALASLTVEMASSGSERSGHQERKALGFRPPVGNVVAVGIDLADISAVRDSIDHFGARYLDRIFTPGERAQCAESSDPTPHLAARFAAKEATIKALMIDGAHTILDLDGGAAGGFRPLPNAPDRFQRLESRGTSGSTRCS